MKKCPLMTQSGQILLDFAPNPARAPLFKCYLISLIAHAGAEVLMKLYVTYTSPYARLARIVVIEKALEDRIEIIEAKTRTPESPYYQINRQVVYLISSTMLALAWKTASSSVLISTASTESASTSHHLTPTGHLRLEFGAQCDGISVWTREISRPVSERSPTVLAHELARSQRMADVFEHRHIANPLMHGPTRMANLILAVALERARYCSVGDLTDGRPQLASWMRSISDLPSMQRTAPP